jgi:hypothetical protein
MHTKISILVAKKIHESNLASQNKTNNGKKVICMGN